MIGVVAESDTLERLVGDAIALADSRPRSVLGIAGSPGAGKSTLVEQLLACVRQRRGADWAAHVPMDGFHLADEQLRRLGALERKGAPDTFDPTGYAQLLERVAVETDAPVYAPGFDRTLEQPLAASLVVLPTARLVVTEGNYLLLDHPAWRRARRAMDRVWFVTGRGGLACRTAGGPPRRVRQESRCRAFLGHQHRPAQRRLGIADRGHGGPGDRQQRRRLAYYAVTAAVCPRSR